MKRSRRVVTVLASCVGVVLVAGVAAAARLPQPGSPGQVAALVASSHTIEQLPSDLVPSLSQVQNDNTAAYFYKTKEGCAGTTACAYGYRAARTSIVLFGDSHAAMWLPALDWVGRHLGDRVVLLWRPGCPAADVHVWNPSSHSLDAACDAYRKSSLAAIEKLSPALVLTSNRTTNVRGANGKLIPSAEWQSGLESTIASLLAHKLHVAVIGDVSALSSQMPQCLAAYPKHVQRCSSPDPNRAMHTHLAAEEAAARAESVPYLNPQPWLCTKVCSPVIGKYAAYSDWQHVTATYAAYLSLDWEGAIKPLLARG